MRLRMERAGIESTDYKKICQTIACLGLILVMVSIAAGCAKQSAGKTDTDTMLTNNKPTVGEITDPVELEQLWQEYIYDGIATIFNSSDWESSSKIDPNQVARFCFDKYIADQGVKSLKLVSEEDVGSRYFFPLADTLEYAKRYFNLTALDETKLYSYDPVQKAFNFYSPKTRDISPYTEPPWNYYLEKVTRDSEGTIVVVLKRLADVRNSDRVDYYATYMLKPREDSAGGGFYFLSGKRDYVNNNLVSISGEYKNFDKITGFEGDPAHLSLVGEFNGNLIVLLDAYSQGQNTSLFLIDPETMTVEKELNLDRQFGYYDVRQADGNLLVRLEEKVIIINADLKQVTELALPEIIQEKLSRTINYDRYGKPDIFFGGYDVSGDLSKFVYTDEQGLKLFDLIDNREKLLAESIPVPNSLLINYYLYKYPQFTADDRKVIAPTIGYEFVRGFTLANLETGASQLIDLGFDGPSCSIKYDNGMILAAYFSQLGSENNDKMKIAHIDFETGEVKEASRENMKPLIETNKSLNCLPGWKYSALVSGTVDYSDEANSIYYLNRLNLDTLTVEPDIVTIKAAWPNIIGVLQDGRILFSYQLNPSESGIGMSNTNG